MCRTRMQIDLIDALRRVLAVHELQITPLVEPFDQLHRFDYGLRDALDPNLTGSSWAAPCWRVRRNGRSC